MFKVFEIFYRVALARMAAGQPIPHNNAQLGPFVVVQSLPETNPDVEKS
jgi:hypothetical protein